MIYAKIENGAVAAYPYTFDRLRKDNPNISFPKTSMEEEQIRSDYGVVEVSEVDIPRSETHNVSEGSPVNVGGTWTQVWNQTQKVAEELNKQARDNRLRDYGSFEEQIEFITEQGLEAWQANVAEIKLRYPKP
tara:strand:+ start:65 stop:463 length:399 start_codon:yes stop_codon:yes gene_type:complete